MKSDLRNLVTAEEAYFSDYTTYIGGTASNLAGTGTPLDVTLSELAIESFFPADEQTADAVRAYVAALA
jgi:hypothetical protein